MKAQWQLGLASAIFTLFGLQNAFACTEVRLTAKDGTILIGRSMEFAIDLHSNLRSSVKERSFSVTASDGKPGLSWKAKYGYVYLDGFNLNITIDGLNEAGLDFAYLYLPGETQYQTVPAGKSDRALSYDLFGDWILSNFKTIDEVRQAVTTVYVFPRTLPGLGNAILPAHALVHDASGKGIVIEFVEGKMNVYDDIGVMTNSPQYPWHVTNLRNFLNLSPYNPKPVSVNGLTFSSTGQGSGMIGLPGDFSSPSRFVKMSVMLDNVFPANNAAEALNLAEHMLNNVDIPAGVTRTNVNGTISSDSTEWVVFKDITHKIFYYRTYQNLTIRSVALDKMNFNKDATMLKMPLAEGFFSIDVTNKFLNSTSK